jgi:hypothetical protein
MKGRGLTVTEPTPEALEAWRAAAEAVYPQLRGDVVPADVFDRAMELLKEYRASAR